MRILVLTKRQYSGKDLIDDRFGRLWELPKGLVGLGHDVLGICLSYRPRDQGWRSIPEGPGGADLNWVSLNLGAVVGSGLFRYCRSVAGHTKRFRPDIVWAASDSFHAVLGVVLAKQYGAPCVVDLYDNFESFPATRWIPGMRQLFRYSLAKAHGISCVSIPLQRKLIDEGNLKCPVEVVENATDSRIFSPRDKGKCRAVLDLPQTGRIIGTAGALHSNRGIRTLMDAFERLTIKDKNIHLAFAGPRDRRFARPLSDRVHDLGILPQEQVPLLLNALDVAVISNLPSEFGNYCFPQKFYEILSCNTPLVAASVGALKLILSNYPQCLFTPGDPASLAVSIEKQLSVPCLPDLSAPQWSHGAAKLDTFFRTIARV